MRIVAFTDLSREGNDCHLWDEVALCESFGKYFVTHSRQISNDGHLAQCYSTNLSTFKVAYKYYRDIGGDKIETVD